MRAFTGHAALVAVLALASFACDERPARPTPPSPPGTPSSLEIQGTTRYHRPGDTGQLIAVAVYSNGMRADAANLGPIFTIVGGSSSVAIVGPNGFVKATDYGRATAQVTCKGQVATIQIVVVPEGMFLLSGQVTQGTQQAPVSQAQVQVHLPAQSFTTFSDAVGRYSLPAIGAGTLTIEALNYNPQTLPISVNADTQLDIVLNRSSDAFVGTYTLAFTASPSCVLPAGVSSRRYVANVQGSSTDLVVLLSGAKFKQTGPFDVPGFTGTRSGNDVRFTISTSWEWSDFSFAEDLGDNQVLFFEGQAKGSIDSSGQLKTMFDGTVTFSTPSSTTPCKATDHRLDFIR